MTSRQHSQRFVTEWQERENASVDIWHTIAAWERTTWHNANDNIIADHSTEPPLQAPCSTGLSMQSVLLKRCALISRGMRSTQLVSLLNSVMVFHTQKETISKESLVRGRRNIYNVLTRNCSQPFSYNKFVVENLIERTYRPPNIGPIGSNNQNVVFVCPQTISLNILQSTINEMAKSTNCNHYCGW